MNFFGKVSWAYAQYGLTYKYFEKSTRRRPDTFFKLLAFVNRAASLRVDVPLAVNVFAGTRRLVSVLFE